MGKKKNKSVVSRNDQSHEKNENLPERLSMSNGNETLALISSTKKKKKENPHAEM